ncbi:MAG: FMN-binding protein [Bacteroidales bacterium]|nr:FMN-binding protein [Bacteroidales bacterium]
MKTFSNRYIFIYITVMVTVIALLLTLVSLGLKPMRERNQQIEKSQQILKAAGYGEIPKKQAVDLLTSVARQNDRDGREAYDIQCADGTQGHVLYVKGKGLWGPIWGYIVLSEDFTTVKGVVFAHKSETPGLGDRITEDAFQQAFVGKKLYDKDGNFISVRVLPKGRDKEIDEDNRVDAITGATLTSRGVDEMLKQLIIDN